MPLPVWDLLLEQGYAAGGAVSASASLTKEVVGYRTMTLTVGRRGPHALAAIIPFAPRGGSEGYTLDRFDAWRELRVDRAGVPFLAGFQGAAAVPGGENGATIALTGYGNAMALAQFWGQQPGSNQSIDPLYETLILTSGASASRADNAIATMLQYAIRGTTYPGTRWFPSAYYTLATGTYTPERLTFSGMSQLEVIQTVCDSEGWEWRAGVDASGNWTFAAGSAVNTDRTATVLLDSPGNCTIANYQPDATRLATRVTVAIRNQGPETVFLGAYGVGVVSVSIGFGTGDRYFPGAWLRLDPDGPHQEDLEVAYMVGEGQINFKNPTTLTHAIGERIIYSPAYPYVREQATTAKTSEDRHHRVRKVIYNDQLRSEDARTKLATTILNASDDLLHAVAVVITDIEFAESLLTLGLYPGDTVSLTSQRLPFTAATMQVQEMRLTLQDGGLARMELLLGDPADDALAVLERWYGGARASSTRVI
jgi:hypothetical protein